MNHHRMPLTKIHQVQIPLPRPTGPAEENAHTVANALRCQGASIITT